MSKSENVLQVYNFSVHNLHYGYFSHHSAVIHYLTCCLNNLTKVVILDAGCGKSNTYEIPYSQESIGIDISRANVYISKKEHDDRSYLITDLNHLPFSEKSFDAVLLVDVIEHIKNKSAVLNELARVTKKGGFFVGSTSNLLNPTYWLDANLSIVAKPMVLQFHPGTYHRHGRFSAPALNRALTKSGFKLCSLTFLGIPPFRMDLVPWIIPWLWILFQRITRQKTCLVYLKENLLWQAIRL